jgi:hypothetical protein
MVNIAKRNITTGLFGLPSGWKKIGLQSLSPIFEIKIIVAIVKCKV